MLLVGSFDLICPKLSEEPIFIALTDDKLINKKKINSVNIILFGEYVLFIYFSSPGLINV